MIAAPLEAVAKAHPDMSLGSYPFFGDGGYGSNLVLRGRDPEELAAALEGSVSTSSTYFRVRARAAQDGQACSVLAWVEREKSGDVRILQWLEQEG